MKEVRSEAADKRGEAMTVAGGHARVHAVAGRAERMERPRAEYSAIMVGRSRRRVSGLNTTDDPL